MFTEGERQEALLSLKDKLVDAKEAIIVDNYFFSISSQKKEQYCNELKSIFPKNIDLLIFSKQEDKYIIEKLLEKNVKVDVITNTEDIHDRLLIVDMEKYYLIGSSFNGIGLKLCFIYELKNSKNKQRVIEYLGKKIPKGKKYHATKSCRSLSKSKNIKVVKISDVGGRGPCKICY